jgi:N-acetylneuraminic acid mutarotase
MRNLKLAFYIFFSQIIVNISCQQYVPVGRYFHTATLVGTKIYFLGGQTATESLTNDFFYLDISKSFDKTKEALPFVDLTDKALEIPPHQRAVTTVFGELKDLIFLFGGNMERFNDQFRLAYSFSTVQLKWRTVTVSQGTLPLRKQIMGAVTDNHNKIYIFGGGSLEGKFPEEYYNSEMYIFDATNKFWTKAGSGLSGRDGHTATFLPDTGEIVYIGGITYNSNSYQLIDITNVIIHVLLFF